MISLTLNVIGKYKTENFSWYSEETAPRPKIIKSREEALKLLSSLGKNNFALRVITINTNKFDLTAAEMEPGGTFEVALDDSSIALIADVNAKFKLTTKNKEEEKELKELFSSKKLSFHVMELRIERDDVFAAFGPEGGVIVGGNWDDKTTWPVVEIVENSLMKKK